MPPSKNDELLAFSKSLEMTNDLVQKLLEDLHEGEISFAEIRTELKNLILSFQELSKNLKYSDSKIGDITVKMAVLENSVKLLEAKCTEQEEKKKHVEQVNIAGKWTVRTAMVTGIISLIIAAITSLHQCV